MLGLKRTVEGCHDQQPKRADVAIIGAGPVGLFAIFECGMLKMNCHVVDALESSAVNAPRFIRKPIYDIPAHPAIDARDLIAKLRAQAAPFNPVHLGQQVATMREKDGKPCARNLQGGDHRGQGGHRRRGRRRLRSQPSAAQYRRL